MIPRRRSLRPSALLICGAALALTLSPWRPEDGRAWAGDSALEARIAPEFQRWWYDTYRGDHRIGQFYLPVDLLWRTRTSLRVQAGADLAWSHWEGPDGAGAKRSEKLDMPGGLRLGLESGFLRDRLRIGAGASLPLVTGGLTLAEARVAEALEETALSFPLSYQALGSRIGLQGAGTLVRGPGLLLQAGLGIEKRGSYDLLPEGPRLHPGLRIRAAGTLRLARDPWLQSLTLRAERAGRDRLDGGTRFDSGEQASGQYELGWYQAPWRAGLQLGFLARAHGTASAAAPLDLQALRGGNVLWGRGALQRSLGAWMVEGSLGSKGVRGFGGDLGHAQWIEPGLKLTHAVSGGLLEGGVRLSFGHGRSGRSLHGLSLSGSWSGGLL